MQREKDFYYCASVLLLLKFTNRFHLFTFCLIRRYRPLRPQPVFNFNRDNQGSAQRRDDDGHIELGVCFLCLAHYFGSLILSLGDASIASPFTSHVGSAASCVDIIRQGRGSLVTTIEIYKIIALNCLVNAFILSVRSRPLAFTEKAR